MVSKREREREVLHFNGEKENSGRACEVQLEMGRKGLQDAWIKPHLGCGSCGMILTSLVELYVVHVMEWSSLLVGAMNFYIN